MSDDETSSRRRFMGVAIGAIFGAIAFGYLVPMVNYIVRPSLRRGEDGWSSLGPVADLPAGEPRSVSFTMKTRDGWSTKEERLNVWAVKKPDGAVEVFSPVCPHLGCGYNWNEALREFICPCHGSVFKPDGSVVGGPAPRGLDTLDTKVEGGVLYVRLERFRLGVSDKQAA